MFVNEKEQPEAPILTGIERTIRVTERQIFKTCRRKWKYGYKEQLVPKTQVQNALSFGTQIHRVLAEYYRTLGASERWQVAQASAWEEWRLVVEEGLEEEYVELGRAMLEGYFDFSKEKDKNYRVVAVEHTFTARIPGTRCALQGTCDVLLEDARGGLWILDHKTYRQFLTPAQIEFDDQQSVYMWLLRQNGIKVRGAIYNMLRKKAPAIPTVLASNGRISKNKAVDTDVRTFMRALEANGQANDIDEYLEVLEACKEREFFKREYVSRSEAHMNQVEKWLPHEAREMMSINTPYFPHFSRECAYCAYSALCRTETNEEDMDYVIQNLYARANEDPDLLDEVDMAGAV